MKFNVKNKKLIFAAISLLVWVQTIPYTNSAAAAEPTEFCKSPITKYETATKLTPKELYDLLRLSGFRGQALKHAWAVAMKESHGNPLDHNYNPKTGDNSYGIFQINVYGALQARIDQFNLNAASDLKDPVINAQIAFYMSAKGKNWSSWKANPGQRDYVLVKQYLSKLSDLV